MTALDFPASPTNGQVYEGYVYDSTAGVWKRIASGIELNSISDVNVTSVADEDILRYNSGTSSWVNEALPAPEPTVINTDGDPGTKIYVGAIDPDVEYTPVTGDVWIEVPSGS